MVGWLAGRLALGWLPRASDDIASHHASGDAIRCNTMCLCTMPRSPPNILEHVSKMFWCIFGTVTGTLPGKSRTKKIVKGNVYLDDLGMGSIYVIKYRI